MAARNAKKRAKLSPPEPPPVETPNEQPVDEWVPNYGRECEVCGQTPCVTGMHEAKVVYDGSMCGVCTWGDAACLDPANW